MSGSDAVSPRDFSIPDHPAVPTLAMLLCAVLWGTGFVAYKEALTVYDPVVGAFGRQCVGLVVFFAVFGPRLAAIAASVTRADWGKYAFVALCEPCFYYIFMSFGIRLTTAAQTGVIMACVPVVVTLAAWLVLGERPGPFVWAGFAVVIAGMGIMNCTAAPTAHAANPLLGNLLLLGCCLCSAGYMVGLKKFALPYPMLFSAAFQAAAGTLFFGGWLLLTGAGAWPEHPPLLPTLGLVYTGVAVTFGVYVLFNFCIPRLPMGRVTAFINLVPVVTVFVSWLLGETLSALQLVSCVLILAGVMLSQRSGRASA